MEISFVVPMYNESENIRTTVEVLGKIADSFGADYEIIIVDDYSKDSSVECVRNIMDGNPFVRLFELDKNSRFGGALAKGLTEAKKDTVVYIDADLPVITETISKVIGHIEHYDVVTVYSIKKKGDNFFRKTVSLIYNLIIESLFGLGIRDINSGFKVFRKYIIKDAVFFSESPFIDVELFMEAKRKGAEIMQLPVQFVERTGGKSEIARLSVIAHTIKDILKACLSKSVLLKKR